MRFALRTLVPVFSAVVVLTSATVFWSGPAIAQEAKKTAEAPAKDAAPAGAAPAAAPAAAPLADAADPKPLLEKAEASLKAGDFAAALDAFNDAGSAAKQALSKSDPNESQNNQKYLAIATIGRARAETGLAQYESAEKDIRSLLQDDPTYVPALVALGQVKLESGNTEDAVDQFRNALKGESGNTDALFGLGKSLALLGHGEEALSPLTRVITADPKNAEAYRLRGQANAYIFKNKQAMEDVQKAIELKPDDYESYFALGRLHLSTEDYRGAVDQLGKAIEHYKPKAGHEEEPFFQGYVALASAYIELGKLAPKDSPQQKASYQASLDACQKLMKQLDEKNPAQVRVVAATLFSRGVAERMLGQLGAAVRTFTRAIEIRSTVTPDDSTGPFLGDAYYRRGICFHLIGEDKMAISDFESASHLVAGDPRPNLWEGFTYAKIGDYQQALRAYGDAIAASDRFTPAYENRARTYMMMGNYKKAIADFNDAIRLDPVNAEYYFNRGVAYELLGDYKKASESYSAAIEFDKTHSAAHRHMISVLEKMDHKELAEQYRKKLNQLTEPKNVNSKSASK